MTHSFPLPAVGFRLCKSKYEETECFSSAPQISMTRRDSENRLFGYFIKARSVEVLIWQRMSCAFPFLQKINYKKKSNNKRNNTYGKDSVVNRTLDLPLAT